MNTLDELYRNGGKIVEDREIGRDCVSQMRQLQNNPRMLGPALEAVGITDGGDEPSDPSEFRSFTYLIDGENE